MLSPVKQKFILHWGEMGARWGINRTVAQIHAFLFLSPEPADAEEIAGTLSVARSSVSTSLRELQNWGIVNVVHVLGDRRDHFESIKDVWELFQMILDGRKRREVDPTIAILRACLEDLEKTEGDDYTRQRLEEMLEFFETMTSWYEQMRGMSKERLDKFLKMGSRLQKLLGARS